ncbi:LysR family transcriptional regulator [Undibacterium terreum]|uniref:Isoleucine biosynthesis transcriptional activator n=1 Tax=Undibacterium terreum TaxID=1224302 RepID=A0A916UL89_9BURK|nr:LysR family transcriptional regulator [Undibacterium terreum]GGC76422.1 isoleucine biosynthesis transcriptional activator [Undibacterium terreum]
MNIELRQLRYFVAVAEEMHFGRAAAKLHMTQPPLSQTIQALEAALGTPLFLRSTRHIALTPAGQALLPEAQRLVLQALALPQLVQRAAAGASGHLSLAFVSIADYSVLPPYLREFRASHADVQIELREATSDVQLEALEKGQIDAGLLIPPLPDRLHAVLNYQKVLSEPLILAVPEALGARKKADMLASYKDLPLIIFPRKIAPALHDVILGRFRDEGLTPLIGQEAIQMQTIVGLVSAGMGIALVPQSVSNLKRPGVLYHALKPATATQNGSVEIGIAWRKDNASPVLQAFLKLLRN